MEEFNPICEICNRIIAAAEQIAQYEKSIVQLQAHGENSAMEAFAEAQVLSLEQLQKLTVHITGVLIPEQEEEFEENLDEAEGGSVFMAGELDDTKPPIDVEYPEGWEEETKDE